MKVYVSLLIIGLGITGNVSSETLKYPSRFYLGATGLFVAPSETGIGMVTDSWLLGTTARSKPFDPNHKWAGNIKLGYNLPNSANNIEVDYLFLDNKNHAVNDFSDGSTGFGSILFPDAAFPATPGFVSDAYLTYKVDQADLKVGRTFTNVSQDYSVHPSLGIRYIQLKHSLTFAAPGNMISNFKGAGPLFSLEGNYHLNHGFGLVGYFDYGLIAGTVNAHSFVNLGGPDFNFVWPKRDRIVSSITAKLGVDYSYNVRNANVVVEAGYQVNEYLNSFDTIRGTLPIVPGTIQRVLGNETNSFGFQGPYISLKAQV